MNLQGKPLKYRAMCCTGTFETSALPPACFQGVTGNFDGAGMSFGVLQWNFGTGTLQPILRKVFASNDADMQKIFGSNYNALKAICQPIDTSRQVEWADSISSVPNRKMTLNQPWRDQFKTLGATDFCIQVQIEAAVSYFDNAKKYFETFGFFSERAYALCFDICVQCGSIGPLVTGQTKDAAAALPKTLTAEQREIEVMKILAIKRAAVVKPEFVNDVHERKMCIATGVGNVHGQYIDLAKNFNITMAKAVIA